MAVKKTEFDQAIKNANLRGIRAYIDAGEGYGPSDEVSKIAGDLVVIAGKGKESRGLSVDFQNAANVEDAVQVLRDFNTAREARPQADPGYEMAHAYIQTAVFVLARELHHPIADDEELFGPV